MEHDLPLSFGKQRIVFSAAYVFAGVKLGTALAYNNIAGTNILTAVLFNA